MLISNQHLAKYLHTITINAFTNLVSFLVFSLIIVIKYKISFPSTTSGWYFVLLASFFYCIAFYLQLLAVKNMGSVPTSLLLYLEPIVLILSAILLLNESLSMIQIIGTIIVITSLIVTSTKMKEKF